jgi:membrane protein implicated in regulation of membrane protease activity
MRSINVARLVFIALVAAIASWPAGWRHKIALIILVAISGLYALLLRRLRSRRIGSAAVGSFYDMLDQDKRRAVEIVVEKKAEEQPPEDAEGTESKPRRAKVHRTYRKH